MSNTSVVNGLDSLIIKNGIQSVKFDNLEIDICLNIEYKSDYLFFCFSGAKPINKELPYFNRWKWGDIFHSSIVAISDYTLKLSEELQIGWYQNNGELENFKILSNFIKELALKLGYKENKIILYGSSAGGFAALKCTEYLPLSRCIAINAQTDISKYYKSYYELLKTKLPQNNMESYSVDYINQNTLVVQNLQDTFHYNRHYLPFLEKFKETQTYLYSHENGHGAEPKEIIPHIILKVLSGDNFLNTNDIDISIKQLEIANLAQDNWVNDEYIKFVPQGRKDLQPIKINFPIDWNMDPLKDKNWKFQFNMWRFFDKNLNHYAQKKDINSIIPLRKVLCAWYEYNIEQKKQNDFLAEDMAIGGRAMRLAFYMSADRDYIESDIKFKNIIAKIVSQHIVLLTDYTKIAFSNHTLTDIHGLMALSQFLTPFLKLVVDDFIDKIFPKLLSNQFSEDGFHKENSPEYHFFGIKCFDALKRSQWFEKYKLSSILNVANKNKNIFYLPDGRILPFGDSSNNNEHSKTIKESKYGSALPEVFHNAGYVVFRKNGENQLVENASYFAIMAGLRSRFHKQNDNLSFIWFEGEDIIRDFGKFAYKRDQFRNYATSTESHNTLKFNNINMYAGNNIIEDQFFDTAVKKIIYKEGKLNVDAEVIYNSENLAELNRGITHKRNFSYIPGQILTIIDEVDSNNPVEIKQYLHFSEQWSIRSVEGNKIILLSSISGKLLNITINGVYKLSIYHGSIEPLQGWSSTKYAVAKSSLSFVIEWSDTQKSMSIDLSLFN